MADLFGNPDAIETQPALAVAIDLFAAAAEAIAFEGSFSLRCDDCGAVDSECFCIGATASRIPSEGGRNVAQVKNEMTHPGADAASDAALDRRIAELKAREAASIEAWRNNPARIARRDARLDPVPEDETVTCRKCGTRRACDETCACEAPEALPADGLFVVGSTTWGFDDAGRYRVKGAK